MAKYVLIEFPTDEDAEGFIFTIDNAVANAPTLVHMRVVGVFKKPTIFCECASPSERSVRGAKWNWWLCTNKGCGKPKRGNFQSSRNLRDPEKTPVDQRRIFLNIREPLP